MADNQKSQGRARGRASGRARGVPASPQQAVQSPQRGVQSPQRGVQSPQRGVQSPQRGVQSPQRQKQKKPQSPLSPQPTLPSPTSEHYPGPSTSQQQDSGRASGRARGYVKSPPPQQYSPQEAGEGRITLSQVAGAFRGLSLGEVKPGQGLRRGAMRGRFELVPPIKTRPDNLEVKQGTDGKGIEVVSNHFRLIKKTDWALYQYRVDFSPEEERTKIRKAMLRDHKDRLGEAYMFDGTMLFTIQRMRPDEFEVFSIRESDQAKIRITIKLTNELAVGDFQYIQLYNIILRHCMDAMKFQLVGREYFDPTRTTTLQSFALEIWPGYNNSINQYEYNVMMLIDVSHKVLRTDTVLDFLNDLKRVHRHDWMTHFNRHVLGCVVFTFYNNKPYRVDDIAFDMSPLDTFKKGNTNISYIEYYGQKYNANIKDPKQPLLISRPRARDIRGGRNQNIVLVPELCQMTGLSDEMRTNFNLMKAVAEKTRIGPTARIASYYRFMDRLKESKEVQSKLSIWNFKFASDLERIKARRLDPEPLYMNQIVAKDKSPIEGHDGDWTRQMRGRIMFNNMPLQNWFVVIHKFHAKDKTGKNVFDIFLQEISRIAKSLKYEVHRPEVIFINDERPLGYVEAIEKQLSVMSKIDLVMCIINGSKSDIYGAIKKKCCCDRGVASQVVATKTLSHKNLPSVVTKIIIQINCKLGGSPWFTPIPFKIVPDHCNVSMVVGFDVCHDSKVKDKSVGAMVASLDYHFTKWYSAVSKHNFGEELSNDIAAHIVIAVYKFKEVNKGALPPRIILYRDGVGESNVGYVLEHEVSAIKSRLNSSYPGNKIKLMIVLVSKRIQTRIFLLEGRNAYNPQPGTVVDDIITSPEKYDFFLVSQSVRQGTVTPTNYHVIYDTMATPANIIQRITYKMCHLYYNCSTTVRVPAQVQYAHKLAFLVGQVTILAPLEVLTRCLFFL